MESYMFSKEIKIVPKKILVLQQRQLGDVLLSTPVLSTLKQHFPEVEIDFFTEKKCLPIVENNPNIHEIICLDKEKTPNFLSQLAFYRKVGKNKYDIAISLQNLPRCLLQVLFSKAKYKLGEQHRSLYKNMHYTHITPTTKVYSVEKKFEILAPLHIKNIDSIRPQMYLTEAERMQAHAILQEHGYTNDKQLILMDVTSKRDYKTYPPKYYAMLMQYIKEAFPNVIFFFVRGPGEEDQVRKCTDFLDGTIQYIFPENCPDMRTSAAIISNAHFLVGNCSLPRHFAAAFDVPTAVYTTFEDAAWKYPDGKHIEFIWGIGNDPNVYERTLPEVTKNTLLEHIAKYL